MIDQGKHDILGVLVNAIDYEAAVEKIIAAARAGKGLAVSTLPVHSIVHAVLNPSHLTFLNHHDLAVPDGQPVRWALNWLYRSGLPDRVYGPSLMLKVCRQAALESLPIYLYGGLPEAIQPLTHNLQSWFPGLVVAGAQPGRYRRISASEKEDIVEHIRSSGAKVVFVGLGGARQEVWISEYRDLLSMPLIAVGAAFDFHAGRIPQAPAWMQEMGLEWFFRLLQEPGRLWKRYALYNPLYVLLLALQASGLWKAAHHGNHPPEGQT
jgi:exopolysaccharide biosynthesis WecB/TagA/CpsF family protein